MDFQECQDLHEGLGSSLFDSYNIVDRAEQENEEGYCSYCAETTCRCGLE